MLTKPLHIDTPLIKLARLPNESAPLTYLKMDVLQPSGSFKIRGIGLLCQNAVKRGTTYLVSSSGGNAGLATAYAGAKLGLEVTVVVPETTSEMMRVKIAKLGAEVLVHGRSWYEANQLAIELSQKPGAELIHPFDHPDIWQGHSTLVDELVENGFKPDAIILSVGGGGLFCGIKLGLLRHGWNDVEIIAVETVGAHSLYKSLEQGHLVSLEEISSIALSLGAKQVCSKAFELAQSPKVKALTVTDKDALEALVRFANDAGVLVEPACGASLAIPYFFHQKFLAFDKKYLVVVCGGSAVSRDLIKEWLQKIK